MLNNYNLKYLFNILNMVTIDQPKNKDKYNNKAHENQNPIDADLEGVLSVPEITVDMILEAISNWNWKCFKVISDKYILIEDGKSIVENINKCVRLRKKWVNYCGPISYKKYKWSYYFLEHKAQWQALDFYNYDGEITYNEAIKNYFSFLELLSNAPQEHYNKFFDDIESMKEESLRPDYCSLWNLFYDPKVWFSFIDVYPYNTRLWNSKLSVSNIFKILLNSKFTYKNLNIFPI